MGTRLDVIVAAVREINDGDRDSFGTFATADDEDCWVQYSPGVINAAYPFEQPPLETIVDLDADSVQDWKARTYVTINVMDLFEHTDKIASWIDRYFTEVLGCGPQRKLEWNREQ
jgi:hypothetical protein